METTTNWWKNWSQFYIKKDRDIIKMQPQVNDNEQKYMLQDTEI